MAATLCPNRCTAAAAATQVGVLSESAVRFYTGCVVSALSCCHRLGAVFRDLKPENLLVDKDGYLKLCDFGTH